MSELGTHERRVLEKMVHNSKSTGVREFSFFNNSKAQGIKFEPSNDFVDVTGTNLRTLEELGYIKLSSQTFGGGPGRLLSKAFDEVEIDSRVNARYVVLAAFYSHSHGRTIPVNRDEIRSGLALTDKEFAEAIEYLTGEDLIQTIPSVAYGYEDQIALTHRGKVEFEKSKSQPRKSTDHFPTQVILNHCQVAGMQIGDHNAQSNVQQLAGNEAIMKLLFEMREHLHEVPDAVRVTAKEHLDDFEAEVKSKEPKPSRLKAFGTALALIAKGTAVAKGVLDVFQAIGIDVAEIEKYVHHVGH